MRFARYVQAKHQMWHDLFSCLQPLYVGNALPLLIASYKPICAKLSKTCVYTITCSDHQQMSATGKISKRWQKAKDTKLKKYKVLYCLYLLLFFSTLSSAPILYLVIIIILYYCFFQTHCAQD